MSTDFDFNKLSGKEINKLIVINSMKYFSTLAIVLFIFISCNMNVEENSHNFTTNIIGHRGGVVDSITPENSKEALLKAVDRNYWMVEIDMRLTKDLVLITHHDRNFVRYFNENKNVSDMTWNEISLLKSDFGTTVQKLEDVFKLCQSTGMNVMLDNKIKGFDIDVCEQIVDLLDKYNLRENALMIGTTATTEFFTGKVSLSCTREQLEANMNREDYNPNNYYFFGNPSEQDAVWAKQNEIMIVGVINEWAMPKDNEAAAVIEIANHLKALNISYVQLDSKYDVYFKDKIKNSKR